MAPDTSAIRDACVRIEVQLQTCNELDPSIPPTFQRAIGSGFFVAPGRVLTCAHVVCNSTKIECRRSVGLKSKRFPARLLSFCPKFDLAVLSVPKEMGGTVLPRANAYLYESVNDLDTWAAGFPLGHNQFKLLHGKLSGWHNGLIQITNPINRGNSGGPNLVEVDGTFYVIGVNSSGVPTAQNVGYAVPINRYLLMHDRTGHVRVPTLGLCTHRGGPDRGPSVHFVSRASPLHKQLVPGDELCEIRVAKGQWVPVSRDGEVMSRATGTYPPTMQGRIEQWPEVLSQLPFETSIGLRWRTRTGERREWEGVRRVTRVGGFRRTYCPEDGALPFIKNKGMVVRPLTMNLAAHLPGAYTGSPAEIEQDQVVVTSVTPGSEIERSNAVQPGSIVESIVVEPKGAPRPVQTLADLGDLSSGLITLRNGRWVDLALIPDGP